MPRFLWAPVLSPAGAGEKGGTLTHWEDAYQAGQEPDRPFHVVSAWRPQTSPRIRPGHQENPPWRGCGGRKVEGSAACSGLRRAGFCRGWRNWGEAARQPEV